MNRFVIVLGLIALMGLGWMACIGEPPQYTGVDDVGLDSGDGEEPDADGDLDTGDDAGGDADTGDDAGCESEPDEEFCANHGAECGVVTGDDQCGETHTVNCDEVDDLGCEAPRVCAENSCECEELSVEDICHLAEAECGSVDASEVCSEWDVIIDCGVCEGDKDCSESGNFCGCPCEIGDQCYASGATDGEDVCQVCSPDQSENSFSDAEDGTFCGDNKECQSGECKCKAGFDPCGDECVDFETDLHHCGGCAQECDTNIDAEAMCVSGDCIFECNNEEDDYCPEQHVCADLMSDDANCGGCGNNCRDDQTCFEGDCCVDDRPDEEICREADRECGTMTDECGNEVICDHCENGESCQGGQCICPTGSTCCASDDDCDGTLDICCADGSCSTTCGVVIGCEGCPGFCCDDVCSDGPCS